MNSEAPADHPIKEGEVLDLLSSLVDKSLVIRDEATARFRLPETLRQYSLERLCESSETSQIRDRHRDYYLSLTESTELNQPGIVQTRWLAQLEVEVDNVYSATNWSNQPENQNERARRMVRAVWRFWFLRHFASLGEAIDLGLDKLAE